MRARVLRLAGWALACLLLAGCLSAADRLALAWPAIGVRMSAPVNADACEKAAELAAESGARVSFWAEEAALLSTPRAEAEATAVRFWGDGSLAWPAAYLAGGAPASADRTGCAISAALAWQLYGSLDAVGQTLKWAGSTYTVLGVLDTEETAALFAGDDETPYTAAEFVPGPDGDAGEQARSFAASAGLGADAMVYGPSLAAGCRLLAWLPLGAAAVRLALHGLTLLRRRSRPAGQAACWVLAVGLAAALPLVLAQLPAWLVPSRWSDFAYWSQLSETLAGQLRMLLAVSPALRDVGAKTALLQSVLCGLGALWTLSLLAVSAPPARPAAESGPALLPSGENAPEQEE